MPVTLTDKEVRAICTRLWNINCTCAGNISTDSEKDLRILGAGQAADDLAITIAEKAGLEYGDFDFDETNLGINPDSSYKFSRKEASLDD